MPRAISAPSILFGRAAWTTLAVCSGAIGFFVGIRLQHDNYDPYAYASGVGSLFAAACTAIAFMMIRGRMLKEKMRAFEARAEELADRNWELREAEERARSLLEAQGDLIVRRDAQGNITYANDAFCELLDKPRGALIGQPAELDVVEQGDIAVLADGTRAHDQKIACGDGARWVAWREVAVRSELGSETQGVGRDVTDRVEAERALANARDQAEAASRAKARFLATCSHEIRTPINGVLGMVEVLLDTQPPPERRTYANAAADLRSVTSCWASSMTSSTSRRSKPADSISSGDPSRRPYGRGSLVDTCWRRARRPIDKDVELHPCSSTALCRLSHYRRRSAPAPGATQPGRQCHQVHRTGRRRGHRSTARR